MNYHLWLIHMNGKRSLRSWFRRRDVLGILMDCERSFCTESWLGTEIKLIITIFEIF